MIAVADRYDCEDPTQLDDSIEVARDGDWVRIATFVGDGYWVSDWCQAYDHWLNEGGYHVSLALLNKLHADACERQDERKSNA